MCYSKYETNKVEVIVVTCPQCGRKMVVREDGRGQCYSCGLLIDDARWLIGR